MPPTVEQARALMNRGIPFAIAKNTADVAPLTHTALTGTVDNTLADIATADAALEADLKKLASKINEIIVALDNAGITV